MSPEEREQLELKEAVLTEMKRRKAMWERKIVEHRFSISGADATRKNTATGAEYIECTITTRIESYCSTSRPSFSRGTRIDGVQG